jgi:hypothetical protein
VSVLPPSFPIVAISTVNILFNSRDTLKLLGTILLNTKKSVNAVWSVDDSSVNLATLALTPVSSTLSSTGTSTGTGTTAKNMNSAISTNQQIPVNLVLPPNVLQGRMTYTFRLTARISSTLNSTSAAVVVAVNGAPLPGYVTAIPSSGLAYTQRFLLQALNWADDSDSLPISYSFGFISQQGNFMSVQSRSEAAYAEPKALSLAVASASLTIDVLV